MFQQSCLSLILLADTVAIVRLRFARVTCQARKVSLALTASLSITSEISNHIIVSTIEN